MPELRVSLEWPVARLVLDWRARRNAITAAMWADLPRLCAEIESRSGTDVVIVQGAGRHFCFGADITEFGQTFSDIRSARSYLGAIEKALLALSQLDRPALAKMRGAAIGGGLAIALAYDLRIVADNRYFAISPAKLAAKDLLYSGRAVCAAKAPSWGLIDDFREVRAAFAEKRSPQFARRV